MRHYQILRGVKNQLILTLLIRSSTKDKWGEAIKSEITGLFDNETFVLDEKPLPADEIIPAKLACKTKLNIYGGLDKLKARVCLRGDLQIKDDFISWSPTASTRLLKCFIADAIRNKSKIFQLDFIQAFIQSKATKRMFVILDKEFSHFCPKLSKHFGRPLTLWFPAPAIVAKKASFIDTYSFRCQKGNKNGFISNFY